MIESFLNFFSFSHPNVVIAAIGVSLIGFFSGSVGTFLVLDKKSLLGDAISHSLLPGICLAFLINGSKSPLLLLTGAVISGLMSTYFVDFISNKSKLSRDAALAIGLSFFFSIGIMLLTYIQHNQGSNQAGLESYLFGKAASISLEDTVMISIAGVLSYVSLLIFYRQLKATIFNRSFASSQGISIKFIQALLNACAVIMIAIGIQAVGVVLMAALILAPASISRFYSKRLEKILILSGLIGAFGGLMGTAVSYTLEGMPTGPWIVLVLFVMSILSIVLNYFKTKWQTRSGL